MRWGRLVHSVILEPEVAFIRLTVWEGKVKRGKAWDEFEQKAKDGHKEVVTKQELAELQELSNNVHANRHAHRLIEATEHEVSLFWEDEVYGKAKARLDGLNPEERVGIVEVKTTRKIDARGFGNDCANLGYPLQLGWYQEAAVQAIGKKLPVTIICIENKAPFDCVVRTVPQSVLDKGLEEAVEQARKYRIAEHLGEFAGVNSEVEELLMPSWYTAVTEDVALEIGGEKVEV
jgi:hypothetical protein